MICHGYPFSVIGTIANAVSIYVSVSMSMSISVFVSLSMSQSVSLFFLFVRVLVPACILVILYGALNIYVWYNYFLVSSQGPYEVAPNLKSLPHERGWVKSAENQGTFPFKRDQSIYITFISLDSLFPLNSETVLYKLGPFDDRPLKSILSFLDQTAELRLWLIDWE